MRFRRSSGLENFEQFLLFFHGNLQIGGDGVGKLARIFHAHCGDHRVVVQALREFDVLLEKIRYALGGLLRLRAGLGLYGNQANRGAEKPSSLVTCTTFARSVPSTRTLMLPSGSFTLCTMLASVPT